MEDIKMTKGTVIVDFAVHISVSRKRSFVDHKRNSCINMYHNFCKISSKRRKEKEKKIKKRESVLRL